MGLLDDVLGSAVPGGNLAKPLMIAATALLAARATGAGGLGNLFGGSAPSFAGLARYTGPEPGARRPFGWPRRPAAELSTRRPWRHHQLMDRTRTEPADHAGPAASGAGPAGRRQSIAPDRCGRA